MKTLALLLIIITTFGCVSSKTDIEKAIQDMDRARSIHARYVSNPNYCNGITGSWQWHSDWIKNYDNVITLLEELEDKRQNQTDKEERNVTDRSRISSEKNSGGHP